MNVWLLLELTHREGMKSSLKAVLYNKVGDLFFLFSLGCTYALLFSLDFGLMLLLLP